MQLAFLADIAKGNHKLRSSGLNMDVEEVDSDASEPGDTEQVLAAKRHRRGIKAIARAVAEASLKPREPVTDEKGNVLTPRRASMARRNKVLETPNQNLASTLKRRSRKPIPEFDNVASSKEAEQLETVKEYHSPRQLALARKEEEARNTPASIGPGSQRGPRASTSVREDPVARRLFNTPQSKGSSLDFQSLRNSLRRTRPAPSAKPDVFDASPSLQRQNTTSLSPRRVALERKQTEGKVSTVDFRSVREKLRPKNAIVTCRNTQQDGLVTKPLPPLPTSPVQETFAQLDTVALEKLAVSEPPLPQRSTSSMAPLSATMTWNLPSSTSRNLRDFEPDSDTEVRCTTPTPSSTLPSKSSTPPLTTRGRAHRPPTPRPRSGTPAFLPGFPTMLGTRIYLGKEATAAIPAQNNTLRGTRTVSGNVPLREPERK